MAIQPQLAPDNESDTRIRRPMVPTIQSGRWVFAAIGALLFLSLASKVVSLGSNLQIQTNASGGLVHIDDRVPQDAQNGVARFVDIPFGDRQIQITHQDFAPIVTTLHNGWFSKRTTAINLKPLPVSLQLRTTPDAEVLLNNISLGKADGQGYFQKDGVDHGWHQLLVRLFGHAEVSQTIELHPPVFQTSVYLTITPEHQRQISENQARIYAFLTTAREHFLGRRFPAALAAVGAVLDLDSRNTEAISLRAKIEETMNILK